MPWKHEYETELIGLMGLAEIKEIELKHEPKNYVEIERKQGES